MNHPSREDLIEFLYEELSPEQQAQVESHLQGCAECRAHLEAWRAVRLQMASWNLPARRPAVAATRAASAWYSLRWAAAAVVLVMAGFGLARFSAPAPKADAAAVRAAVAAELQAELAKFATDQSLRQERFQQAMTKALGRLEAQRLADYTSLRRDMETVAVRAEDELESTRQNMIRLANLER